VLDLCLDAECIEEDLGCHRRTAAGDIDVDALAVQILEPSDVLAGENVNFFIV
jgi:hypothetical protein